jgi:hypothetical protein
MNLDETMDLAAVAALLQADPETIAQYARTGELPGTRIGKGWIFLWEDVLAFLRQRIAADTAARRAKQTAPLVSVTVVAVEQTKTRRRTVLPSLPAAPSAGTSPHARR